MDKEARELRLENDSLLTTLDTRVSDVQSELTLAYKEKAALAEKSLHATKQLSVVRDNFDHQQKELEAAQNEIQSLKDAISDLKMELDLSREALHTASNEAIAAAAESSASSERAAELERENLELAHRLVELKSKEIERMNEINKIREEIMEKARQDAGNILDEARSQMLRATSQQDGGVGGVASSSSPVSALGRLSFLDDGGGGDSLVSSSNHHSLPSTAKRHILSAHPGGVFGLAFTNTGNLLASCGADKTAKLWNPITHTCTATLHGSFEGVNAVTFTSNSKLLLGAESRQAVRVWNVGTGRLVQSLTGHTGKVTAVTANPINASAVASCAADRSVKLWGLEKGYCIKTLLCHSTPNCVVYMSDASLLVSSHFDGSLRMWDPKSGKMTTELTGVHSGQAGGIAVSPDGVNIITVGKDNVLKVIDARTFGEKMALTASSSAYSVGATWAQPAISPTGTHVAVGSGDGKVVVWELSTGGVVNMLGGRGEGEGHGEGKGAKRDGKAVLACRWSPKGLPLVSGSIDGGLTFWGGGGGGF